MWAVKYFGPPYVGYSVCIAASLKRQISGFFCTFQRAIDEPCTLPLRPPKGGTKRDFAVCVSKIQLCRKRLLQSFFV